MVLDNSRGGWRPKRHQSKETVNTDKWDREDRQRMLAEVKPFAAARRKLAEFAATGEAAMNDVFAWLLKAEPELLPDGSIDPTHLVNRRIMDLAGDLDVTERVRRYTVNDDVQTALSCETMEPDMETLFDMTEQQRKQAEQYAKAMQALAQAHQQKIDLDDLIRKWAETEGLDEHECEMCGGTGMLPEDEPEDDEQDGASAGQSGEGDEGDDAEGEGEGDGAGEDGEGEGDGAGEGEAEAEAEGEGEGEGEGKGKGTPCPNCLGTGSTYSQPGEGEGEGEGDGEGEGEGDGEGQGQGQSPKPQHGKGTASGNNPGGSGRGEELTDEQRDQLEQWAQEQEKLREAIEQAQAEAEARREEFDGSIDAIKAKMRGQIHRMMNQAADEAQATNETAMTWGLDPGELHRLPAEERIDLAKRLNNDRMKRIAQLFGPMKNMMLSEQQRKTVHVPEEVFDVTLGNDVGRLLPQEVLNLATEEGELDFMRRYTEGKLLMYDMQGVEKLAKGAIIFCEDGSGSMSGEREMWAKAVMLCLLHLARQQKRAMHILHFGGPGQVQRIDFNRPEDFTFGRILEAAELFFGGGTDFATPMKQALEILDGEFASTGKVSADVVFVTDDECWVTEEFMQNYLDEMHKFQATTWGISVSGADRREGALDTMTEGKVATIKDFLTGEDIRHIFRGV